MRRTLAATAISAAMLSVCPGATAPSEAAFPGSNGLIVYFNETSGGAGIWTVDPVTKRRHQLTTHYEDQGARFSPDGQWILFGHGGALALIRPDGSHKHIIARPEKGGANPSWSPDGRRIVYTYGVFRGNGPYPLHVMHRDGTHDHSLSLEASCAAWSPNGAWLTATIERHYMGHIVRLRPDGTRVQRLTHYRGATVASDGLGESCADWAPDGQHLVYRRAWSDSAGDFHFGVFVMRPDGTHDHAITTIWSGPPDLSGAAYSPDGRRVVYIRGGHVFAIDSDGGHRRQLTSTGDAELPPSWQPT